MMPLTSRQEARFTLTCDLVVNEDMTLEPPSEGGEWTLHSWQVDPGFPATEERGEYLGGIIACWVRERQPAEPTEESVSAVKRAFRDQWMHDTVKLIRATPNGLVLTPEDADALERMLGD